MFFRHRFLRAAFLIVVLPVASTGCSSCARDSEDQGDPAASSAAVGTGGGSSGDLVRTNRLQQPGHLPAARHDGTGYQIGRNDAGGAP